MSHLITSTRRTQSFGEELANSISHGLGLIAILVASPFLISSALSGGGRVAAIGAGVFGVSAALLYLSSLVYHALPAKRNRSKSIFQIVDHSAIYLLIAGTYTPFTLGILDGIWGRSLLSLVWILAVAGIAMKLTFGMRYPKVSLVLYLGMGWIIVLAAKPLIAAMPLEGLLWIAGGGLSYTVGVYFYAKESVPYFHFVWHLFVLVGTACHFIAVYKFAY